MPEVAMRREIIAPVTLSSLVDLKKRWKVSIQALIHRAYDLGIVTERQYRYLFEQLSAAGWRKDEPGKLPVERPRAFRKMAELLYSDPINHQIDYQKLANDINLTAQFVKQVMEVHLGKDEIGPATTMNTLDLGKLIPFDRKRTRCS
jgi:Zn-dependent peptidase ImmA (M78 family)